MRVRMLAGISGTYDGNNWPKVGEEAELPDAVAVDVINSGLAEAVAVPVKEERAVAPTPEKRTARKAVAK